MNSVFDFIPGNSIVHRLSPLSKICWAAVVMILALLSTNVFYLGVILMSVLLVAFMAGIAGQIGHLMRGLIIFSIMLIFLQVIFIREGMILCYLLPGACFPVSKGAVIMGVAMSFRMMSIVLSFYTFLSTTQFKDLFLTMTEKLKLPADYVFMFMTALRFIPSFLEEIKQVRDAQVSRGCNMDGKNPLLKIKAYIVVAVPMVMISLQKAERLAIAMATRGYGADRS